VLSASFNTAVGTEAGKSVTTGVQNTLIGSLAGDALTDADFNVAMGYSALTADTLGSHSVAIGHDALASQNFTSATNCYNTAVGSQAGAAVTTGVQNTLIGGVCGDDLTTGDGNVLIGYNLSMGNVATDQTICIGYGIASAGSNNVKIGVAAGNATLTLDGSDTSWAAASDERLKKDVADSTVGLDFIKDLRPVTFKWNAKNAIENTLPQYDSESSDPVYGEGKAHHGFIAQEVKTVIDAHSDVVDGHNIWNTDPDGTQQVAQGALVPMLVKAIQELSAQNDALTTRITALEG
jgi:trimeric autotransporter adhesin